MRVRLPLVLALSAALGLNAGLASIAAAQGAYPPIPKPSERKTGTLEGWDSDKEKPAARSAQPKGAQANKPGSVASARKEKPAAPPRDKEDGGLPLPRSLQDDGRPPVGFDSKGNVGTSLRF